jgi:thiamine-phosphate pyrophosphorylase
MDMSEGEIYRILDANLNRAREGLRVVEEVARFVLEEKTLQRKTKSLRHRLASLFTSFPRKRRAGRSPSGAAAGIDREMLIEFGRDAVGDVGRDVFTGSEARRAATAGLIQANFARIEESLRAMEEFTKFLSGEVSARLKAMRFEVYSLEKEYVQVAHRVANVGSLRRIGLYPVIDRETIGDSDPLEIARQVLLSGVKIVQYRDKVSPAAEMCEVCAALREIAWQRGVIFIVNDRADIARASDADGVHLGQDDLPVSSARQLLGSRKIIGKSTHSLAQARRAAKEDVDYIAVGPIFSTPAKPGTRPVGTELLARVRNVTDKPIIAIGGINRHNLGEVLEKGADGAAVISAILKAKNVRAAAVSLRNICRRSLKNSS